MCIYAGKYNKKAAKLNTSMAQDEWQGKKHYQPNHIKIHRCLKYSKKHYKNAPIRIQENRRFYNVLRVEKTMLI